MGRSVGNHRVLSRIGQGGMGAVYLGEHAVLGRKAAIKVLLPEFSRNAGLVARFLNEARATAQLRHPAFVEIFDSGTLPDGSAYLVMEYLEGEDLGHRIWRTGPMPLGDCLLIARAVADGAGFAHRHHIIHRDLKPDNVFLTVAPDRGHDRAPDGADATGVSIKVLDFGIAKLADPAGGRSSSSRTGTGVLLGTPLYMSPEQCRGAGHVDHRSDIYSLGCIIHAMLVGTPPFNLEGFGEIIAAHLGQPPPALRPARPDLPPSVETFVASLLAKSPDQRPPDMERVVAEIDRLRSTLDLPNRLMVPMPAPAPAQRPAEARPRTIAATTPLPPSLTSPPRPGSGAGATRRLATSHTEPPGPARKHSASVSTLAGAASAIDAHDEVDPWAPPPARRRRGGLVAAGTVAAVAVLAVAAWRWNGARGRETDSAGAGEVASAEIQRAPAAGRPPESQPAPTLAIETAEKTAAEPPSTRSAVGATETPAAREVVVHIVSTPPGAELTDAASGDLLGQTPFQARFARDSRTLSVRIRKVGYKGKDLQVRLDQDRDFKVLLRKPPGEKPAAPSDDLRKL